MMETRLFGAPILQHEVFSSEEAPTMIALLRSVGKDEIRKPKVSVAARPRAKDRSRVPASSASYEVDAKRIWKTCIPPSGKATTVQGELLRAVEKLRDEAQRNGNANWDDGHAILAATR
jgi:hypothetical protein